MNGTIIGKRLLLNECDSNGNIYPNLDIRYGPYNSIDEAKEILTNNKWLIPFLTIGVKNGDSIKEYWVNNKKELVDKSTNTIVNNIVTKAKDDEEDNTKKAIESIETQLNDIENNYENIKERINLEGIKNDFINVFNKIKDNKTAIAAIKIHIDTITKQIQQIEDFTKKYNSYDKNKLDDIFNSYRMSINNINTVLTKHEELHEKRFDEIVDINNKLTTINNTINDISNNIEEHTTDIVNIRKDIKDVQFNIQYILNIYNSIKDINERINNFIIEYSAKIDELENKTSNIVCDIIKIKNELSDTNFTIKDKVLNCKLQLNKCYIVDWKGEDINTINLIVDSNIGKYQSYYKIVIYGNNYKLQYSNIIFDKNDIPILLKNTTTVITIDNVTNIATYKQINNN